MEGVPAWMNQKWSKMSGVSLPVTRPVGHALLVGSATSRVQPKTTLGELGYSCVEAEDPYAGMAELCRRPLQYRALIVSVSSLYREELQMIRAAKRRFPHLEVWLTDTDGRQGALADGMRLGADGLLADDGMHRIAVAPVEPAGTGSSPSERNLLGEDSAADDQDPAAERSAAERLDIDRTLNEPVLSADELRALLQEQPASPPASGESDDQPGN